MRVHDGEGTAIESARGGEVPSVFAEHAELIQDDGDQGASSTAKTTSLRERTFEAPPSGGVVSPASRGHGELDPAGYACCGARSSTGADRSRRPFARR